jgi:colanic acid/amylovoran biosynthesis protein
VSIMQGVTNYLLEDENLEVVIIPHSIRSDEKLHNNDLPVCKAIYAGVNDSSRCSLVDKETGPQQLRYIIGMTDLFITSRFHGMISALCTETVPLVIGWSHKYQEVLDQFDMPNLFIGYDKISEEKTVKQMIDEALSSVSENKAKIKKNLTSAREHASQLPVQIEDLLLSILSSRK